MSRFSIACQTITFGPNQNTRFPEIFHTIRDAGYAGVEIGYRHLRGIPPDVFRVSLSGSSLCIVATHINGNLFETDASGRALIDEVIEYVHTAGAKRILYSGLQWESADQFARDLDMVNRAALMCAEHETQLCYHNHDHEFRDILSPEDAPGGMTVMDAIIDGAVPELRFCPDVGWIHKAGADAVMFLDRVRDRLSAVHYKDFATLDSVVDTVPLGTGCVPLKDVTTWLRTNIRGIWVIAEQDTAQGSPEDAIRRNASFLRKVF